jgi:hypothetical protein
VAMARKILAQKILARNFWRENSWREPQTRSDANFPMKILPIHFFAAVKSDCKKLQFSSRSLTAGKNVFQDDDVLSAM